MSDYAVRAIGYGGKIRLFACTTTGIVEQLHQRHGTSATVSAALGRTVSVAAMMGLMNKGQDKLTIQIHGDGPVGKIIVDADPEGHLRGYVTNPQVDFPTNELGKLDVRRAVGTSGMIYVTKDLGLKEPYCGSSEIVSGEIGEDFTYYFTQSEQTPSAVGVGVIVDRDLSIKASGGFIVQLLPDTDEEIIVALEERLKQFGPVSQKIADGYTPEQMLQALAEDVQFLQTKQLCFSCTCDHERIKGVIRQLGLAEVQSMLEKDRMAEVTCNFCNERYEISEAELADICRELRGDK